MCQKKIFYKFVNFLLFWLLFTLWIYHFHCFPILFLLLYLSFHLDSLNCHPDFPRFSHFHTDSRPRFQENSYFSLKTNTPLCYYCITLGTKSLFTNYVRSNNLNIKETTGAKLSPFVIYIEAICCSSVIYFAVVAVFINCSNS